jgi:hypothetical protein
MVNGFLSNNDGLWLWIPGSPPRGAGMTSGGVLATQFASESSNSSRLCGQRAQGMPGARCTRGLVCELR